MTKQNQRSKLLAYLLRHKPESANLTLNKEGWCSLTQIIANTDFNLSELQQIVASDNKGRYSFDDETHPTSIRANQGHSASKVKLTFEKAVPPTVLYHGTTDQAFKSIAKTGILPMSRHHVHLSHDRETAVNVGNRRRKGLVILRIDAKQMLADGVQFFKSKNGVWLVESVAVKYITAET